MLENVKEYWYLYLVLLGLIVLTAFVIKKAAEASKRTHGRNQALLAKARREKELRDAYANLTEEIIAAAPADTLFEGIALILENQCQKSSDVNTFYNSLNRPQQLVYAAFYLLTDTKEATLSAFFRRSTQPLTGDAAEAAAKMFNPQTAEIVRNMFDCFDEDNESASVIPEVLDKLDERFSAQLSQNNFYISCGEYIKKNSTFFRQDC
jgi:hypothetical protein